MNDIILKLSKSIVMVDNSKIQAITCVPEEETIVIYTATRTITLGKFCKNEYNETVNYLIEQRTGKKALTIKEGQMTAKEALGEK